MSIWRGAAPDAAQDSIFMRPLWHGGIVCESAKSGHLSVQTNAVLSSMTQQPLPAHPAVDVPPAQPPVPSTPVASPVDAAQLAAFLAARMCHDYISPAGAIISGLDLLDDPSAQDMRQEAMDLIAASAKKLVAALAFDRVAFGSSAAAESFDTRQLETLTRDVFAHVRAELEWAVAPQSLAKPAARTLLNLAQVGTGALPMGGVARLAAFAEGDATIVEVRATGARVRLRPEVQAGLNGQPLVEGLGGHWVQAYYLRQIVDAAGGVLQVSMAEGEAVVTVRLPQTIS
jgi:histidine phosphotransferase ChpT